MKFGVVVFPGSNCDHDTYHVLKHVLGDETVFLWHKETDLGDVDAVVVPGGFSYGDYLRCGAIARYSPIMTGIRRHAEEGKPVLGICNGFQILQEAGLLPGIMLRNSGLKFICKTVHVRLENTGTPFTTLGRTGQVLSLPIAHNEGNFFALDVELQEIESAGQVVFRYCSPGGVVASEFNPNGSIHAIAGVCNRQGNVLGMMPHPERASEPLLGSDDGLLIFRSLAKALEPIHG